MNRAGLSPQQPPSTPELLTVEQFAQRLQVSRATVFVWLHKGVLAAGKHYLKVGRVLRFLWSAELLETINQASELAVHALPSPSRLKKSSSLNWDY